MGFSFYCGATRNGVGAPVETIRRLYTTGSDNRFFISLLLSMVLLVQALKTFPVGSAYAVWTGIGAAGTAIAGMLWLGESRDVVKLISLVLLVAGIIGLRLTSTH
jgi:multidrug transporter EmrE-like cation transporter